MESTSTLFTDVRGRREERRREDVVWILMGARIRKGVS
jgi:hypothetical protein